MDGTLARKPTAYFGLYCAGLESESESEYLFGHFDPVTPAKTVADRCRGGY